MPNLREQLELSLQGRVCFMGLGNLDYGDDGFGVRLAEELIAAGVPDAVIGGISPDRWIGKIADFDHVLFLDAVDCGGAPGSVVFLNSGELTARFPQISTHKDFAGSAGEVRGNQRNHESLAARSAAGVAQTFARAHADDQGHASTAP